MTTATARPDLYRAVHKGLRACLTDALLRTGSLDVTDRDERMGVVEALHEVVLLHRTHLEDEERFLHPALHARAPGLLTPTDDDHRHHALALDALEGCALRLAGTVAEARAARSEVYDALAAFLADDLVHTRHEETVNMAALWATHTDEELLAIEHALVAAIPPAAMRRFQHWMIAAATPEERAEMLGGMRAAAPPEVFEDAFALAAGALSPASFSKLSLALGVAA